MHIFSKLLFLTAFGFASCGWGASSSLETMKLSKRFGVGITAGGPLAVLGMSVDVNVNENVSLGLGFGTGLNYHTFMAQGRYFLLGDWVSPYLGVAVARWWTDGTTASNLGPSILTNRFLPSGYDFTRGFSIFILSPAVGVQFMHPMGFAVSVELQYLFRLVDFSNGTYAGLSAHWYF